VDPVIELLCAELTAQVEANPAGEQPVQLLHGAGVFPLYPGHQLGPVRRDRRWSFAGLGLPVWFVGHSVSRLFSFGEDVGSPVTWRFMPGARTQHVKLRQTQRLPHGPAVAARLVQFGEVGVE
jgi:hypothetical protein